MFNFGKNRFKIFIGTVALISLTSLVISIVALNNSNRKPPIPPHHVSHEMTENPMDNTIDNENGHRSPEHHHRQHHAGHHKGPNHEGRPENSESMNPAKDDKNIPSSDGKPENVNANETTNKT